MRLLAIETSTVALYSVPACRQQNRCRSASKQPIQPNAAKQADGNDRRVDVSQPSFGIDERDDQQRDDPAGERRQRNLSRDFNAITRAAMRVGEVTVAAWTSRHAKLTAAGTIA